MKLGITIKHITIMYQKDKIETDFGESLNWDKGENKTSSKIFCNLNNVSFNNENDWVVIKEFMIEKGRKLYDVLIPLCELYFQN